MNKRQWFKLAAAGALMPIMHPMRRALAAGYPEKTVTIIVPGPPAGATDMIARIVSNEMSRRLGQAMIVDNRAGAGGIIGSKQLLRAARDGYTLLMGQTATHGIVPVLSRPAPYNPVRDFAAVSLLTTAGNVLVVPASLPVQSLTELIALGKSKPNTLTYGSPGVGLSAHINGFQLAKAGGFEMLHVPYKGSAPATNDLLAGLISMMFVSPGVVIKHVHAGRLRALAQTTPKRSRMLPDVPTFRELGMPAAEQVSWFGLFAPAGTPQQIVEQIAAEAGRSLAASEVREKLEAIDMTPAENASPAYFEALVKREASYWAGVIEAMGIQRTS